MSDQTQVHELEQESIGKLLLRYSIPAIIAMTVTSLYNIIDSIFIGYGVGALAISGLAVTFPLMNLVIAVCLLVGVGGATVSSIFLGEKKQRAASEVLGNVLLLALLNGVVFGGVCLLFLDRILILFGASEATLPYARDFMWIILLALPIPYVMISLNHVMRATGYPRKAMLSALLTVGCNIVLAPIFIFMLGWGMAGAAIATTLSQLAGLVWVLLHFSRKESTVHFQPGIYRLKKSVILRVYSIGMSPFLMNVCACLVVILFNACLKSYGGDMAIGAFGIVNRVLILFVMTVIGLTQGMQPIVGFNYGAKRFDRMKQTLKYGVVAGVAITSVGFLAAELFPGLIVAMFTTHPELTAYSRDGMRIACLMFPLVGCQIVIGNFFQSIGMAKVSIFLSLTRQMVYLIPGMLILSRFLGLEGIWYSMPVADFLAFLTAVWVFLSLFRKIQTQVPSCKAV